jgi:hypothetical protein
MPTPDSPRRKIHHAIRNEFTESITAYAIQHRHDIDDERTKAAICATLKLMDRILSAVDRELDPEGLVSRPPQQPPTKLY